MAADQPQDGRAGAGSARIGAAATDRFGMALLRGGSGDVTGGNGITDGLRR